MESSFKYAVNPLSATIPIPSHILKSFKTLRLDALHSAPAFFQSNHAHELKFTDKEWTRRILDPAQHHLICRFVHRKVHDKENHELGSATSSEDEWVGMLTLHGPLSQDQYTFKGRQGSDLGSDEEETRWFLGGLFLQSEHRGTEMNTAILEAVLRFLRIWTEEALETSFDEVTGLENSKIARLGGNLRSQDPTLRRLYEALGAVEVGSVDRAEALRIAGNDELIGSEDGEEREPRMIALERIIDC